MSVWNSGRKRGNIAGMLPMLLCSDLFGHLLCSDYGKKDMQINISADRERLKVAYQTSKGKISSVLDHH